MMAGGAVQLACQRVRAELFARARLLTGVTGTLALEDGRVVGTAGQAVAEMADLLADPVVGEGRYRHRPTGGFNENGQGDIHACLAFAAERAVVEVDAELGVVRVVQIAAAMDVGKVINPMGLEGQVEGGIAQGLGLALMETLQVKNGVIANPSFTDYLIPTAMDVPPVLTAAVEVPEPGSPYGLKGVGESPTIVATAAIVGALRAATGRELNRVPVAPDELVGLAEPAHTAGRPPLPQVPGQWPVAYYGQSAGSTG
jgi:CO/xanthine dehydrogenase Mo-binding subunit